MFTNHLDVENTVRNVDCIVAMESAASYLGIDNMPNRDVLFVYSLEQLNIKGVVCTIVDSFDSIDFIEQNGIRCTSVKQTIYDLLRYDRDDQVIQESLADYYYSHDESFDGLDIPDDIIDIFESYREDSIHYYDC
jgi:hypothetical protein